MSPPYPAASCPKFDVVVGTVAPPFGQNQRPHYLFPASNPVPYWSVSMTPGHREADTRGLCSPPRSPTKAPLENAAPTRTCPAAKASRDCRCDPARAAHFRRILMNFGPAIGCPLDSRVTYISDRLPPVSSTGPRSVTRKRIITGGGGFVPTARRKLRYFRFEQYCATNIAEQLRKSSSADAHAVGPDGRSVTCLCVCPVDESGQLNRWSRSRLGHVRSLPFSPKVPPAFPVQAAPRAPNRLDEATFQTDRQPS